MYKVRFVGEEALDKEEITWDKRLLHKEGYHMGQTWILNKVLIKN